MPRSVSSRSRSTSDTDVRSVVNRRSGLVTWVAVGAVVAVVASLVLVRVIGGDIVSTNSGVWVATNSTTAAEVDNVAPSVFDAVGVSAAHNVSAPNVLVRQPPLTAKLADGTSVPEILYVGAEYCPFCAAQRWATIAALGRFGTWSRLGNTESSSVDKYGNTPTFTFLRAKFTSKYLAFRGVELFDNVYRANSNPPWGKLMSLTPTESALFATYDTSHYLNMSPTDDGSIPFISMGNAYLMSGASFDPGLLSGLTRNQIAANLSSAKNPVTRVILTSANEQTAALCTLTHQRPGRVCSSPGVLAAKRLMKN